MPLYEYECRACSHRFEVIQKFADAPVETCPKCGGAVQKLLSAPAFQFKGSGWYITDYARKNQGAQDEGSGGGTKAPAKDAAAKSGASASSDSGKESDKKDKTPAAGGTTTGTSSSSKDAG